MAGFGSCEQSADAVAGTSAGRTQEASAAVLGSGRPRRDERGSWRGAGVSAAVRVRWFREGGGMPSVAQAPLSGRCLSFAEREEIAILRARGCGVREIGRQLGRPPLTISRELRRNAQPVVVVLPRRHSSTRLRSSRWLWRQAQARPPGLVGEIWERVSISCETFPCDLCCGVGEFWDHRAGCDDAEPVGRG
jgi:hypothetical protein